MLHAWLHASVAIGYFCFVEGLHNAAAGTASFADGQHRPSIHNQGHESAGAGNKHRPAVRISTLHAPTSMPTAMPTTLVHTVTLAPSTDVLALFPTFTTNPCEDSRWFCADPTGIKLGAAGTLNVSGNGNYLRLVSETFASTVPFQAKFRITKDSSCNDHFVYLSTSPSQGWSASTSFGAVKLGWLCGTLYLYGPTHYSTSTCSKDDSYSVTFTIDARRSIALAVGDSGAACLVTLDEGFLEAAPAGNDAYLYFGADADVWAKAAKWHSLLGGSISSGWTPVPTTTMAPTVTLVPTGKPSKDNNGASSLTTEAIIIGAVIIASVIALAVYFARKVAAEMKDVDDNFRPISRKDVVFALISLIVAIILAAREKEQKAQNAQIGAICLGIVMDLLIFLTNCQVESCPIYFSLCSVAYVYAGFVQLQLIFLSSDILTRILIVLDCWAMAVPVYAFLTKLDICARSKFGSIGNKYRSDVENFGIMRILLIPFLPFMLCGDSCVFGSMELHFYFIRFLFWIASLFDIFGLSDCLFWAQI